MNDSLPNIKVRSISSNILNGKQLSLIKLNYDRQQKRSRERICSSLLSQVAHDEISQSTYFRKRVKEHQKHLNSFDQSNQQVLKSLMDKMIKRSRENMYSYEQIRNHVKSNHQRLIAQRTSKLEQVIDPPKQINLSQQDTQKQHYRLYIQKYMKKNYSKHWNSIPKNLQ